MLELLTDIASTAKRKEKESFLESTSNPTLIQRIAKLTYDPAYDYYIKDFELPDTFHGTNDIDWALDVLENEFNTRKVTGDKAKQRLQEVLSSLYEDDAEVVKRVVKRDLRCGISGSTINKVWKDTVYIHPYCRCSSYNEKNISNITLPCYSQVKMDGLYVDVICHDGVVEYRSRQGSYLPLNSDNDSEIARVADGFVLMGEALVVGEDGKYLPREDGNGIINSDERDDYTIHVVCWDMVTYEDYIKKSSSLEYKDTLKAIQQMITELESVTDSFKMVETSVCHTTQDIVDEFKKNLNNGEEGSVIKDMAYKWKNGTSKLQIKMKVIIDCDFKIVGWYYGEKGTKNEHLLGGLELASSDDIIRFNVGTGFKDHERESFLEVVDEWVEQGKIVTVKGNGLVTNKLKPDYYALYLGRLVEVRDDKIEADSYDKVVEIIDSFTDTLKAIA